MSWMKIFKINNSFAEKNKGCLALCESSLNLAEFLLGGKKGEDKETQNM